MAAELHCILENVSVAPVPVTMPTQLMNGGVVNIRIADQERDFVLISAAVCSTVYFWVLGQKGPWRHSSPLEAK